MAPTSRVERADPITRLVAQRVAQLRKDSGMNQDELGQRMAALREKWSRSTVVKLETFQRESVSVGDLLALAEALDVPPVTLLADPRRTTEVPLSANTAVDVWDALAWLVGAQSRDKSRASASFNDAAWYVDQAFALGTALRDLDEAQRRTRGVLDEEGRLTRDPETVRRMVEKRERDALETIRAVLGRIRQDGEAPAPSLPAAVEKRAAELGVALHGDGR